MQKMSRERLQELRRAKQEEMKSLASDARRVLIRVGMGTCGLAAGAKETLKALQDELKKAAVADVVIQHTGCMGLCFSEPTVEVLVPGMPPIVYGKVGPDVARKIVRHHVVGKQLIGDYIYDKPAGDIIAGQDREG